MIIEARDLKKHFGSIKALDGVTVGIPKGITLILGPNGGGKSTFLKLATGVYRPSAGEIRVFGEVPWNNGRLKARFGVAYDPPAFPQFTTGREWLTLFAESKGFGEEEVERVAELFEVKGFLDKRISGYSSGMLKRLSLAQAFVGKPELIFLDEPLANIDFDSMERVIEIIEEMKKTNFVVISHIWEPLIPIVDWVVVIGNGKLVLSGEAEEVQEEVEKLFKPHIERSKRKGAQEGPSSSGQEGRQTPATR